MEASVVQTRRARVFGRMSNSTAGIAYYVALGVASFFLTSPAVWPAACIAAVAAALLSAYLAYSLAFVTRMPCAYCWTGHLINWALLAAVLAAHGAPA